ncbi:MAG: hypothetical protein AAFR23_08075 [Pseudomonadota bacterium]
MTAPLVPAASQTFHIPPAEQATVTERLIVLAQKKKKKKLGKALAIGAAVAVGIAIGAATASANKPRRKPRRGINCHGNVRNHAHNGARGRHYHDKHGVDDCVTSFIGQTTRKPKKKKASNSSSGWDRCYQKYASMRGDGTYQPYGGGPRRRCPFI